VIYTEDSYIVQEGKPQGKMLFLVQGSAYTYTTSSNINNVGTSNEWLKRGDFYGQELLTWAFESPPISDLPISTRTVMCQEKIEAFVIRAGDLKSVASSSGILAKR
jgi:cyclic nucleotide gated channel